MNEFPVMLTVPQVCRILQVSRSKVYQMLATGEIPSVSIGRNRRIQQRDLNAFVASCSGAKP